jgi:homogentisate 1,2-dioxygenase
MVTFHPCGFTHGPHPKALKNILNPQKTATDEVAVMLDTRDPLHVADDLPENVENTSYVNSWRPQETE